MAEQENGKRPLSDTEGDSGPLQNTSAPPAQKKIRQGDGPNAPQQAPATAAVAGGPSSADPKLESHSRPQHPQNPPPQQQQQQQQQHQHQHQHQQRPQPRPQTLQPTQKQQEVARLPSRDHSFFGTVVIDDVVRTVADFLKKNCNHEHVEIEAKIGVMIANNTRRRIELPVCNEVVLNKGYMAGGYRFASDMTVEQHAHYNTMLNKRLEQTAVSGFQGSQIYYKHTKEIDQFYTGPDGKTRVTLDEATKSVIPNGIVRKDRIADLDVFSPRNMFDFRVTVNVERPMPMPTGQPQFERHKNRVSYRHRNMKIDLTQVRTSNSPNNNNYKSAASQMQPQPGMGNGNALDFTHELEIEFAHPEELIHELKRSNGEDTDRFLDIVGSFVNNVRGLVVRAPNPELQRQQQLVYQQQQQQQQQRQPSQPSQQSQSRPNQPALPPPSSQQRRY